MCRIPKAAHITQYMKDLHWLPIVMRIRFKVLLLTYRAYHDMAPAYLCELVTPYTPGKSGLRSQHKKQLERTVTYLKSYGDRSFQYAAIKEWHSLPLDIRKCLTLQHFKTELKTHFFTMCYN